MASYQVQKIFYDLGSKVVTFTLITDTMGAPKQLGLTCHTSSPGFIVSKMLEGLWRKTLDTYLQVFKINIALFWSLSERFGNIFSPWILQICIYHCIFIIYCILSLTIWVQIGGDIVKDSHKIQNNIIPLLLWRLSLLSRASFSLAVWFMWVSR